MFLGPEDPLANIFYTIFSAPTHLFENERVIIKMLPKWLLYYLVLKHHYQGKLYLRA